MARHVAGTKPMLGAPLGHNFAVSVASGHDTAL